MKKVLLVLVMLAVAAQAYAVPDLWLYLSDSDSTPKSTPPGSEDIQLYDANSSVTLYLWGYVYGTYAENGYHGIGSIGIDMDLVGDISSPTFEVNNSCVPLVVYGNPTTDDAWDVFKASAAGGGVYVGAGELDDVGMAAVEARGLPLGGPDELSGNLKVNPDHIPDFMLGTLTFDTGAGASSIELKTGSMCTGIMVEANGDVEPRAAIVVYGGGEAEITGDWAIANDPAHPDYDPEIPLGDGVPDAGVPEPATMVLLGLGVLGAIRRRR